MSENNPGLKNILKGIKEKISDSLNRSGVIHGIPSIINAKHKFTFYMWTFFSIGSLSLCIWFSIQTILFYLSFDYKTRIRNIFEQPMLFPTVSFCSCSSSFETNSINDSIISCIYNNDVSCQTDPNTFFETYTDPRYGKCYRFNSGKNMNNAPVDLLYSYVSGRSNGFQIIVNENIGLYLFIHNSTILPYPSQVFNNLNGDGIFISPGYNSDLIVDRTVLNQLPLPYNDCLMDATLFKKNKTLIDFIMNASQTYTRQRCVFYCFDLFYINENPCNCSSTIGNVWQDCFIERDQQNLTGCTFKYKSDFNLDNSIEKCFEYCPYDCKSISYSVSVSFHPNSNKYNYNQLRLYVYYRELKYTLIEQTPSIDIANLISNLGGIFGLFLGTSFLSFVEILELIFELILFLSKCNNTSMQQPTV